MYFHKFVFSQEKIPFPVNDTHKLISRLLYSICMHDISKSSGLDISVAPEAVTLKFSSDTFVIEFRLNTLQPGLPARTCSIEFKKVDVSRRPIHWAESLLVSTILTVRLFGYENVAVSEAPTRFRPALKRLAFSPTETEGLYIFRPIQLTDIDSGYRPRRHTG